jgi:hypothetical protein
MERNRRVPPRDTPDGWKPSKPLGSNRQTPHSTTPLFCFNPQDGRVREFEGDESQRSLLTLYHTASVYYDNGRFWCVNFDATRRQVGNGQDYEHGSLSSSSHEDDDDDDEEDEDDYSRNMDSSFVSDWRPVGFSQDFNDPYKSYVCAEASQQQLRIQRPDQDWINVLFPQHMHSQLRSMNPLHGRVCGSLAVLIALIAFSVKPEHVNERLFRTCIRGDGWRGHTLPHDRAFRPGRGCM